MADAEKEIGNNCGACKKALSRAKRYYRNGDYYCNKNCYKKKMDTLAKKAAEEAAEAAQGAATE